MFDIPTDTSQFLSKLNSVLLRKDFIGSSLSGVFNVNSTLLVKNPNWWEADQLAIYKRGRGDETWDCHATSQYRVGIEPGLSDSKSSALTTLSHCLCWLRPTMQHFFLTFHEQNFKFVINVGQFGRGTFQVIRFVCCLKPQFKRTWTDKIMINYM